MTFNKAESDVVEDCHMGKNRVVLEYDTDVAGLGRQRRDIAAINTDMASGRLDEPSQHAQRRGLAAARWPKQRKELTLLDLQIQVRDGHRSAEVFRNRAEFYISSSCFLSA